MDWNCDWSHQVVLEAEPVSPSIARDFVSEHLAAHQLPELVEDMRLVVSELATNAVAHAQTAFLVTLSMADERVRVAIQDGSTATPVRLTPDPMALGGRGLMIVEVLSQEWGTTTDAAGLKSVWASFSDT
jgi:anti-sigma regulatory factor (Ser/Thr protein kinase)